MDVDTLVFTGSTKIAKQLMVYAGESNMKRLAGSRWQEPEHRLRRRPGPASRRRSRRQRHRLQPGRSLHRRFALLVERSIKDKFLPMVVEA
jgi:4-guanidinobutyraldehyde dehydrogenase/NAD-dependent aldehyde dehydrogenase